MLGGQALPGRQRKPHTQGPRAATPGHRRCRTPAWVPGQGSESASLGPSLHRHGGGQHSWPGSAASQPWAFLIRLRSLPTFFSLPGDREAWRV